MTATSQEIRQAALILESGGLVAFPTETVYGLGADAENSQALAKIFALKDRPTDHPLIVHLPPEAELAQWAVNIPEAAHKLVTAFWPGPLTLILKKAAHVSNAVTGGQDSVGLRCPSHPVAMALLRTFKKGKGGVAAPSANRFGHVSPTTAQHVRDEFKDGEKLDARLGMILDGGQSEVGIESTILDLSRWEKKGAVLLRPGHISVERIAEVIGVMPCAPDIAAPRASGTLESHYAPRTPVVLVSSSELATNMKQWVAAGKRIALIHYTAVGDTGAIVHRALPAVADGYAHHLYASLRALDGVGADLIAVELPPQNAAWHGVNDRLRRAAHGVQST
ncbi:MAG: threonylcarbamoyl-AMP synthase [Oxalobacter sp.]|nr:MAG: threonylcarbamoyl-AMP synthase [Oxalobacter sp.]